MKHATALMLLLVALISCCPPENQTPPAGRAYSYGEVQSVETVPEGALGRLQAAFAPGTGPAIAMRVTGGTEDAAGGVDTAPPAAEPWWDMKAWISPMERQALIDFIADQPKDGEYVSRLGGGYGVAGEVHGWKGQFNTCGYGIGRWVRRMAHQHSNSAAFDWMAAHLRLNVRNWWIYYNARLAINDPSPTGPNEAVAYEWTSDLDSFPIDQGTGQPRAKDVALGVTFRTWLSAASGESGIPINELVYNEPDPADPNKTRYLVPRATGWNASSYGRHHCYDWLAECLTDTEITDRLGPVWVARARQMLVNYLHRYIFRGAQNIDTYYDLFVAKKGQNNPLIAQQRVNFVQPRRIVGNPNDRIHLVHYQVRTLQAYRALARAKFAPGTDEYKLSECCIEQAQLLLWWHFHPAGPGAPRIVKGRDGSDFWVWDQSDPTHPHWHYLSSLYMRQPWYIGLRASAFVYLYTDPECAPWCRSLIALWVKKEYEWASRDWNKIPPAAEAHDDTDLKLANASVQGGLFATLDDNGNFDNRNPASDRHLREGRPVMRANQWAALGPNDWYHPLGSPYLLEGDAGYYNRFWPNPNLEPTAPWRNAQDGNKEGQNGQRVRWHGKVRVYDLDGVSTKGPEFAWPSDFSGYSIENNAGSWAAMPDLYLAYGLLYWNVEAIKTAMWFTHDRIVFSGRNYWGNTIAQRKSDGLTKLYGYPNEARAFYFTGMACGEITRMAVNAGFWVP
jgi:hypothetical protein